MNFPTGFSEPQSGSPSAMLPLPEQNPANPSQGTPIRSLFQRNRELLQKMHGQLQRQSQALDALYPIKALSSEPVSVPSDRPPSIEPPAAQPQHIDPIKPKLEITADVPKSAGSSESSELLAEKYSANPFLQAMAKVNTSSKTLTKLSKRHGIDSQDSNGDVALSLGLRAKRKPAIMRTLLKLKASPNIPNKRGETPMHVAAREGFAYMLAEMIQTGGDKDKQNLDGKTPLDLAKSEKVKRVLTRNTTLAAKAKKVQKATQNPLEDLKAAKAAKKESPKRPAEKKKIPAEFLPVKKRAYAETKAEQESVEGDLLKEEKQDKDFRPNDQSSDDSSDSYESLASSSSGSSASSESSSNSVESEEESESSSSRKLKKPRCEQAKPASYNRS